ncbi:hypothetical protein PAECIP111892_03608 [Paenibacillus auburnensis]|uniref:Uncharacterized protein n=1 Tax=Paenibacillus auburnensis TaxID=2905649 RepID=A0ABM9CEH7_9BACL|nr:hypothetical protein [Paenibacillus auburnensis]CAH1211616.1 hypothetical protein PAECIP111892_03608 [Paenibacillus auburnensis]
MESISIDPVVNNSIKLTENWLFNNGFVVLSKAINKQRLEIIAKKGNEKNFLVAYKRDRTGKENSSEETTYNIGQFNNHKMIPVVIQVM